MRGRERPLSAVPAPLQAVLAVALAAQVLWSAAQPPPAARAEKLPAPPAAPVLRALSLGDPVALSKALMLWLQAFDNQAGVSIPFAALDYGRVEAWLDVALALDPSGQYPLLAAARLYGEVPDDRKMRAMADFVYRKFQDDPARRWPWLAHVAVLVRHRLGDMPLALKYARAIADNSEGNAIPQWARQMHIFLLEEAGELEAARLLIGGLLESGRITDAHELRFFRQRLTDLERRQGMVEPRAPNG